MLVSFFLLEGTPS